MSGPYTDDKAHALAVRVPAIMRQVDALARTMWICRHCGAAATSLLSEVCERCGVEDCEQGS